MPKYQGIPDKTKLAAYVNSDPEFKEYRVSVAMDVVRKASSTSAVRTGAYKASWKVVEQGDKVLIANDMFYSVYLEYGTYKMQAHADLLKAAETGHWNYTDRTETSAWRKQAGPRKGAHSTRKQTRRG